MTLLRRGDVILVPLDFTDRSGTKWRPAVVVSNDDYNARTPDVMVASITSNLTAISHPGDQQLTDWRAAGLLKPSLVQTKLATIQSSLIRRRLGTLSAADLAALDQGLRNALNLV